MNAGEALDTLMHPQRLAAWARAHGVDEVEAGRRLGALIKSVADDEQAWREQVELPRRPAPDRPQRADTAALRAFMEGAEPLQGRMRQVFELCVQEGLTLEECGARLGISRETVRVHLRRLRTIVFKRRR